MMRIASLFFIIIFFSSCASQHIPPQQPYSGILTQTEQTYLVKRGDSLWSIAKTYDVSVEALKKRNKFSSLQDLRTGQRIFIPVSSVTRGGPSFRWPMRGEVVNSFGQHIGNVKNKGLNIKTTINEYVKAAAPGKVIYLDYLKGWGETVIVKHPSNFYTVYANLQDISIANGVVVETGSTLGKVACGEDGNYILHFEIRKQYLPQDPLQYLN
jgi:murein DD-endopeptidase MepM/ murein hydrolase activator NlpD